MGIEKTQKNIQLSVDEILDNLFEKIEKHSYQIRQFNNSIDKGMTLDGIKQAIEETRNEFYTKNEACFEKEISKLDESRNTSEHKKLMTNSFVKLMDCFPRGRLLSDREPYEFLAHDRGNIYFILGNCETKMDVDCKVLEWFSRAAYKAMPFSSTVANHRFHEYFRKGISEYFGHEFNSNDMEMVYTYLGNACNHQKTIDFIESGFDMSILDSTSHEAKASEIICNKLQIEHNSCINPQS